MSAGQHVRVGVISTSWWADSMYLPAIANHPRAQLSAICGRNPGRAQQVADRWQIPHVFNRFGDLIDSGEVDAFIIATANDTHYPITMRALQACLHVLCEKPLALNYSQAAEMATAAERAGVKHMVPFTYSFMPITRYLKELIDDDYLGQPYHLNMRYYTGYGREPEYLWRFDKRVAGAGVVGDLGSHWLYLAQWFYGEITGVTCQLGRMVERPARTPDGDSYEQTDDTAIVNARIRKRCTGNYPCNLAGV